MKTTAPKFDTAAEAALLAAVVRAQRIPCCPLCAEPRRIALVDGAECRVCPRCGDVEPCPAPAARPAA
jgi:hypothetical protein